MPGLDLIYGSHVNQDGLAEPEEMRPPLAPLSSRKAQMSERLAFSKIGAQGQHPPSLPPSLFLPSIKARFFL